MSGSDEEEQITNNQLGQALQALGQAMQMQAEATRAMVAQFSGQLQGCPDGHEQGLQAVVCNSKLTVIGFSKFCPIIMRLSFVVKLIKKCNILKSANKSNKLVEKCVVR